MTSVFAGDGTSISCTLIEAGPCYVTAIKNKEDDGYNAIQLGFQERKDSDRFHGVEVNASQSYPDASSALCSQSWKTTSANFHGSRTPTPGRTRPHARAPGPGGHRAMRPSNGAHFDGTTIIPQTRVRPSAGSLALVLAPPDFPGPPASKTGRAV